jgi:hypothetical protein
MLIIILCFAVLSGGIAVYGHQGAVLLDRVIRGIEGYNRAEINRADNE